MKILLFLLCATFLSCSVPRVTVNPGDTIYFCKTGMRYRVLYFDNGDTLVVVRGGIVKKPKH